MHSKIRITVAVLVALFAVVMVGHLAQAQGGAPPPPPAEGLDPATAPATSTGPLPAASPKASSSPTTATAGAAPPPPSEGLDPATAPSSSTGPLPAAATAKAVPSPSPTASATPWEATAAPEDQDGMTETPSTDASPASVFGLDFMRRALWVGLVVSGVCAYLGVYVVLRRVVFVGVALSQMSSAGVALSLLLPILSPMVGSVLAMVVGVALLSVRWGGRRIRQDAFIGIGYAVASASAILLVAKSPKGEGDLLSLLFGNILTVSPGEANLTVFALAAVLIFHLLFYKELLFVSFDPDTAAASGYPSRLWELLLYLSVGLTIAFAIHSVGVLLPFAALVLPAVTALLLTRQMKWALLTSMIVGMVPVPVGLYLSFVKDLPTGETMVAVSFAILLLVGIFAKIRGTSS